ncbi:peroxiredoxin Q/BCP [Fodinibius salinus]|uniref:thioredoxin-dependent peroxiredoxin n=1 Tax=Fodinibius salinus TaxID=860790 RepID=A0A5D3YMU9_9BACT|nr:redoxin domain-containing protein [Fodinibius salinus]TYP93469.1 peroxiredoxin Q/BCP [Fodinibius salinus]
MVKQGTQIDTDFALDIVKDGTEQTVTFSELLDRPTIVSVYMRNNTSGCDKQNKSLADQADWFDEREYNLVAVSKDSCGSHKNYAEKLDINYILASDPEYKFAEATDSIVDKQMFGNEYQAPSRSAYVIGTDGTVQAIIEKVNTNDHAEELKEVIKNL